MDKYQAALTWFAIFLVAFGMARWSSKQLESKADEKLPYALSITAIPLSALSFVISIQSHRIISPLLSLGVGALAIKNIRDIRKERGS